MQKSFLSSSDNFSERTLIGIDEVFEDTIESFFLFLNIFLYISCLISIRSTTASTIQSASATRLKLSAIFPTLIPSIFDLSIKSGGLDFSILSLAF